MPIAIRNIDHVVLHTADMERAIAFYTGVLGCRVARRRPDGAMVHLQAGSAMIDLVPRAPGVAEGRNMDHVALRVEPFDPDAIAAHLRAHGVDCGPVVQRFGAEGTGPSVYLSDPDGNGVELKGPAEG